MSQLFGKLFSGLYSFERRITSPQVRFEGKAAFKKNNTNQILYREEGQYGLEGAEQFCYQNRIFVVDTSHLSIYKKDNSLLHEFRVDPIRAFPIKLTHTHCCKNDQYSLTFNIHSFDHFSMAYVVKGPSKDYKIETDFTRLSL